MFNFKQLAANWFEDYPRKLSRLEQAKESKNSNSHSAVEVK